MKAIIIGAGNIGALKDHESTDSGPPYLTHAKAVRDSEFELMGFIDTDDVNESAAMGKWCCKNVTHNDEFEADIFVIATPPEIHHEIAMQVLAYEPKGVVIEKPCGANLQECVEIVEAYQHANVPLVVNYQRRYSKLLYNIAKMPLERVFIAYRGGFDYSGGHAYDLENMLSDSRAHVQVYRDDSIVPAMEIVSNGNTINPDLSFAFLDLYVNLHDHIIDGTPLLSPGVNAIYPHLMNNE